MMVLYQPLPTTFKIPISVHIRMKCPLNLKRNGKNNLHMHAEKQQQNISVKYSKCCSSVMHQFAIRQVQMLLRFLHKHSFIQCLFIEDTKYEAPPLQIKCMYYIILIRNVHEPFLSPGEIISPQKCKRQIKTSAFSNVVFIQINHSSRCPIASFGFLVRIFPLNTQNSFRPQE